MDDVLKLYDVNTERNILKTLLSNEDFLSSAIMFQRVILEHFADLFHRDSFKVILEYYKKFGIAPSNKDFKRSIVTQITSTGSHTLEDQRKLWVKGSSKLYVGQTDLEKKSVKADLSNLDEMRKARLLQTTLISSQVDFEDGNYDKAFATFLKKSMESQVVERAITEGDIVGDYKHHVQLIDRKQQGEFKPIPTHIVGCKNDMVALKEGKKLTEIESLDKTVSLDECIGGGLYKGDMTLLIGENNIGKSFFLMELCFQMALNGTNVVLFTIEMNKDKQLMRIYSRLTQIPYIDIRTGDITQKQRNIWKNKVNQWKVAQEDGRCGILKVVSFDRGATVQDIENKLDDVGNEHHGAKFEMIAVDYMNDMKPMGDFKSNKGWDAQGDISWGLTCLAKAYDNHEGIVVVTATQRRPKDKENRDKGGIIDWEDAALSKEPTKHASVGIGLYQTDIDKEKERLRWRIWKNRDGKKFQTFLTYPRFDISRIFSNKRMYKYYDDLAKPEKKKES